MHDSRIITTQDGSHSLESVQFGVTYHSVYGAVQESRVVFLNAGLMPKTHDLDQISILEVGFGTGLNAFMSLLEAEKRALPIRYLTYEAFPISSAEASRLNYPHILGAAHYTADFMHLHRCPWSEEVEIGDYFLFQKERRQFQEIDYDQAFDIIYYDAFSPSAQPELWEADMFAKMFRALKPNGVLVTYCAKGAVKRALKSVGFTIEALPGPPGKREMTRARKVIEDV